MMSDTAVLFSILVSIWLVGFLLHLDLTKEKR